MDCQGCPKCYQEIVNQASKEEVNIIGGDDHYTPLTQALDTDSTDAIKILLSHPDIDVNKPDGNGKHPVFYAIGEEAEILRVLIEEHHANTEVLHQGDGNSILHQAVDYVCDDSIRYLIEKGCPIDARNNQEETPLLIAMKEELHEVIPTLLEKGANVNAVNSDGLAPLNYAVQWLHDCPDMVEILEILLEKGADPNNKDAIRPLSTLLNCFFGGMIHVAMGPRVLRCAQILISREHDPDSKCGIEFELLEPERGIIHKLIDIGLEYVEFALAHLDVVKALICMFAESSSNEEIITPADPNVIHNQLTPLHRVCLLGWTECIPWFARGTADFNLKGPKGEAALHIAAKSGNEAMVQALLNGGAKVSLEDDLGNTALDVAMKLENQDCIKLLARSLFSNEKWPKRARNTLAQGQQQGCHQPKRARHT